MFIANLQPVPCFQRNRFCCLNGPISTVNREYLIPETPDIEPEVLAVENRPANERLLRWRLD